MRKAIMIILAIAIPLGIAAILIMPSSLHKQPVGDVIITFVSESGDRVDPIIYEEACRADIKTFAQRLLKDPKKAQALSGVYDAVSLKDIGLELPYLMPNSLPAGGMYFRPLSETKKSNLTPDETWWGYEVFTGKMAGREIATDAPFVYHKERCLDSTGVYCHIIMTSGRIVASNAEGLKKRGIKAKPFIWEYEDQSAPTE